MTHTCSLSNNASEQNKCDTGYEYAVYSYGFAKSAKKGQVWRQHGVSNNQEEAFWIAEQLKACDTIERIEIRLQGINPKTKVSKDKKIRVIDKSQRTLLKKFREFFSA